jgi:hypothetical protein
VTKLDLDWLRVKVIVALVALAIATYTLLGLFILAGKATFL